MLQIASFPFKYIGSTRFGKIYRPYAIISVYSKTKKDWQQIEVIVDSGADYTLFPHQYARILGIDIDRDCQKEKTVGIGGVDTVYQYRSLPIKIGSWERKIPVGFLKRDNIPALLGRLACIEEIRLIFENHNTILEYT